MADPENPIAFSLKLKHQLQTAAEKVLTTFWSAFFRHATEVLRTQKIIEESCTAMRTGLPL